MRIGIFHGGAGETDNLRQTIQKAVHAEEDGFDEFWLPQTSAGPGFDALTVLSLAGTQTSRISLGTGVVPIFTIHPLTLAKHALTAQIATGGRLTLGIGLSHRPAVEDVMGLSYENPAQRMAEYLYTLRPLLDDLNVDYSGRYYNVSGQIQVTEARQVPVIIAALAPRMLRIAGGQADGTITWMAGPKTIGNHVVPRINAAANTAARPQPQIYVGMPVAVTDDGQAGRDQAGRIYQRYGQLANYRRMLDIEGVEGPSEVAIIGNEVEVERQLRSYADAGATDFVASIFPVGDDAETSKARTWDLLKNLVGKIGG